MVRPSPNDLSFRLAISGQTDCSKSTMRILITILFAVILFGFAGCSRSKEGSNFTHVKAEDEAMNAAIEKAKATIGDFVQAFHAQKPGTKEFCVKKPYATPSGGHEHMWIEVTSEQGGVLRGTVANEAEDTREVKIGQEVSLGIAEISDWKYQEGKKLIGGYTIRYFVDKMSLREREEFLKQAGFEL
jgi:uncharacterized protein YegJ (DUF2314 family)